MRVSCVPAGAIDRVGTPAYTRGPALSRRGAGKPVFRSSVFPEG